MKKTIINDLRVELDPPYYAYGYSLNMEERAKALEKWAKELCDFIRDHRSQDSVIFSVIRDKKEICCFCQREWETDEEGLPLCCDNAQIEFDQEQKEKKSKIEIK